MRAVLNTRLQYNKLFRFVTCNVSRQFSSVTKMDSNDTVTIAAIQMCSTSDKEKNFATGERLIRASLNGLTQSPVKLVCLPECFFFIGENIGQSLNAAENIHESPVIERYSALAKELNIWLSLGGFQECAKDSGESGVPEDPPRRISNAHIIISPTGEVNPEWVYRKVQHSICSHLSPHNDYRSICLTRPFLISSNPDQRVRHHRDLSST
jgi:hypothetical protein